MVNSYFDFKAQQEKRKELLQKEFEDLKVVGNGLFSSPNGKKYAKALIKASRYFDVDTDGLSDSSLRYISAQRDFVGFCLINLVDKNVLLDILEEIN